MRWPGTRPRRCRGPDQAGQPAVHGDQPLPADPVLHRVVLAEDVPGLERPEPVDDDECQAGNLSDRSLEDPVTPEGIVGRRRSQEESAKVEQQHDVEDESVPLRAGGELMHLGHPDAVRWTC